MLPLSGTHSEATKPARTQLPLGQVLGLGLPSRSGSVARKAVVLLNAQATGNLAVPSPDPAIVGCLGCHGVQGTLGNTAGRMSCAPCHAPSQLAAKGHAKT